MSASPGMHAAGSSAVQKLLSEAHVAHRLVAHPPTYTAWTEASTAGVPAHCTAKTVVTIEAGMIRLAVIPASRRLDMRRLRDAVHASARLRLATEPELHAAFPDFEVGAIPPLGRLIDVDEVVDPLLLYEHQILAAGGDHTHGLLVDPEKLVSAASARVADICKHHGEGRVHRFSDLPSVT